MRMMLKFSLPWKRETKRSTTARWEKRSKSIMNKLKPEAAYFGVSDGKRGGMLFFDLAEPSQVVEAVEPFFLNLNAAVELIPVMNGDDLRRGLAKASQK